MDMVQKAVHFAAKKHGGQMYGDGVPYMTHLACVMHVLYAHKAPEDVVVAGVLHDVLEDTDATYEEVEALFGKTVAKIVLAVTNPREGTRKERHAIQYPKILAAGDEAIMVKLADRIANVSSGGKTGMYHKEKESFKLALYSEHYSRDEAKHYNIYAMWEELDGLLK